jgi:hypothetical protein
VRVEIAGSSWGSRRDDRDLVQTGEEPIMTRVVPGVPHEDYRVLVMRASSIVAEGRGRRIPSTADYARGKAKVDKMLVDRGVGVAIPGARPGRVTR